MNIETKCPINRSFSPISSIDDQLSGFFSSSRFKGQALSSLKSKFVSIISHFSSACVFSDPIKGEREKKKKRMEGELTHVHEFDRIDEQYFVEIDLNVIDVVDAWMAHRSLLKPQVVMEFQQMV